MGAVCCALVDTQTVGWGICKDSIQGSCLGSWGASVFLPSLTVSLERREDPSNLSDPELHSHANLPNQCSLSSPSPTSPLPSCTLPLLIQTSAIASTHPSLLTPSPPYISNLDLEPKPLHTLPIRLNRPLTVCLRIVRLRVQHAVIPRLLLVCAYAARL